MGHAYSALTTWDLARRMNGRFLLRIEDIDLSRSRPEWVQQILDDLAWLQLSWEEPVRRQSMHFDDYQKTLHMLKQMDLLYPCFATRTEILNFVCKAHGSDYPKDPDGSPLYPGIYKATDTAEIKQKLADGEPHCLRIHMDRAIELALKKSGGKIFYTCFNPINFDREIKVVDPSRWGDAVIARKDVPTSYHLSVVVDDALQNVTHVTRGKDLEPATDIHRLLQILLDLPAPFYHHHRLITDDKLMKLSKSRKAKSLARLKDEGLSPNDIRFQLGLPLLV